MKRITLAVLLLGAMASSAVYADNIKIAVIDFQRIMQEAPQVAKIRADFQSKFKPRQEKIVAAQKALKDDSDKLQREASVMSETDRMKLQQQVDTDKTSVDRLEQDFRQDLASAQNQAMSGLLTQVKAVVTDIATKESYDLVLRKNDLPYANDKLDITNSVISGLTKQKA